MEKCPFHLGRGKSGNVRESQGGLQSLGENSTFVLWVREDMSFFIITKVLNFFS